MRQNDGGPAFPTPESHGDDYEGMSLRDYFAAKVFPVIANHGWANEHDAEMAARFAYKFADAMLKERAK